MKKNKERVFTFKADETLAAQLDSIPNKSEFIRKALQRAMEMDCPLCHGTGVVSAEQQKHLEQFLHTHSLTHCDTCHAVHFVCDAAEEHGPH